VRASVRGSLRGILTQAPVRTKREERVDLAIDAPCPVSPRAYLFGGKMACIFCASITLPAIFIWPFMKAMVPLSWPFTIFT
jgi:hypothetical protein